MTTPSKAALDLAVKPAGYSSWDQLVAGGYGAAVPIALAFAELLDKADKVGRMVREYATQGVAYSDMLVAAAEFILPDPIDPDLLEAREMLKRWVSNGENLEANFLAAIKRGRELAKERSE